MRTMLSLVFLLLAAPAFAQEKFSGSNVDTRIGMAFKVSDAALRKLVPPGWEISPASSGPSQGANLNVSIVNMQTAHDADGKPAVPYRGVAFTIPVKKTGTDATVPMVAAGLFTANYAPGAYGVFLPARIGVDRKVRMELDGKTSIEETWVLRADGGHSIDVVVNYVAGTPRTARSSSASFPRRNPTSSASIASSRRARWCAACRRGSIACRACRSRPRATSLDRSSTARSRSSA